MNKQVAILLFGIFCITGLYAQFPRLSISNDLGLQRSFKKEQRYWAGGHTLHTILNFSPKDGAYAWLSYYTEGKFNNELTATAKSSTTIPSTILYRNHALMRFKHFSLGWKRYIKGRFDAEEKWNLYAYGGFGVLLGRVVNSHDPTIDSNDYSLPVRPGKANFKRLTLDLGLGYEVPIGGDVYFYTEARAWIPTTDYPSKHIFVNENAPVVGMLNTGIRILF